MRRADAHGLIMFGAKMENGGIGLGRNESRLIVALLFERVSVLKVLYRSQVSEARWPLFAGI